MKTSRKTREGSSVRCVTNPNENEVRVWMSDGELFHCSIIKRLIIESISGDDALKGNTRKHPEHDG